MLAKIFKWHLFREMRAVAGLAGYREAVMRCWRSMRDCPFLQEKRCAIACYTWEWKTGVEMEDKARRNRDVGRPGPGEVAAAKKW